MVSYKTNFSFLLQVLSLKCKGKYSFLLKILIMLLQVRCYQTEERRAQGGYTRTNGQREDARMRSGDGGGSSQAVAAEASAVVAAAASAGRASIRPTTTIEGVYARASNGNGGNCRAASSSSINGGAVGCAYWRGNADRSRTRAGEHERWLGEHERGLEAQKMATPPHLAY
jgi:hypothetical protein